MWNVMIKEEAKVILSAAELSLTVEEKIIIGN